MERSLLGYEQLSQRLGIKLGTLYSWVSRNKIPHIRLSGKLVRFDPVVIDRWLADRNVSGNAAHPAAHVRTQE
jgi:excisionase family DNA binding protein